MKDLGGYLWLFLAIVLAALLLPVGGARAPAPGTLDYRAPARPDDLWTRLRDRSDAPGAVGGVLVHLFSIEAAEALEAARPFAVNANDDWVTDCGPAANPSCSAWSYLRDDLYPAVFAHPSGWQGAAKGPKGADFPLYTTPVCGVIVDPRVLWPLLTQMTVLDSYSVGRSCCASAGGVTDWKDTATFPCGGQLTFDPDVQGSGCVAGGQCAPEDVWCRRMQSGGGVARPALGDWGCALCRARGEPRDAVTPRECALCGLTHSCALADAPSGTQDGSLFASVKERPWARQYYDAAARDVGNLVGADGAAFRRAFAAPDGALRDTGWLAGALCRFVPSQWPAFVRALKDYYDAWRGAYTSTELRGERLLGTNHFLANPAYGSYLENEVSMYMNPKGCAPEVAARQDGLFRDAILGFFYVGRSCLELHAELEGVTSTVDFGGGAPATTVYGARDRCAGYFDSDAMVDEEPAYLERARSALNAVVARFNGTYRKTGTKIGLFKYVGDGNTFFGRARLEQLKKGLEPSELFVPA